MKTKADGSHVKVYQYLITFDAREMVQIMTDKVPTEEEAMERLHGVLDGQVSSIQRDWHITQVIRMDEEGEQEYLVYDGSRWRLREDVECND